MLCHKGMRHKIAGVGRGRRSGQFISGFSTHRLPQQAALGCTQGGLRLQRGGRRWAAQASARNTSPVSVLGRWHWGPFEPFVVTALCPGSCLTVSLLVTISGSRPHLSQASPPPPSTSSLKRFQVIGLKPNCQRNCHPTSALGLCVPSEPRMEGICWLIT